MRIFPLLHVTTFPTATQGSGPGASAASASSVCSVPASASPLPSTIAIEASSWPPLPPDPPVAPPVPPDPDAPEPVDVDVDVAGPVPPLPPVTEAGSPAAHERLMKHVAVATARTKGGRLIGRPLGASALTIRWTKVKTR